MLLSAALRRIASSTSIKITWVGVVRSSLWAWVSVTSWSVQRLSQPPVYWLPRWPALYRGRPSRRSTSISGPSYSRRSATLPS